jgi:hypothetical protein
MGLPKKQNNENDTTNKVLPNRNLCALFFVPLFLITPRRSPANDLEDDDLVAVDDIAGHAPLSFTVPAGQSM